MISAYSDITVLFIEVLISLPYQLIVFCWKVLIYAHFWHDVEMILQISLIPDV